MSQGDLGALLSHAVDAYNRKDVEGLLEVLDPDVEWIPALPGFLGAGAPVYRGHAGMRQMLDDFFEVLDVIHFEITDIRELGDRVVGIGSIRTRGKASGVETTAPYANVADVRDGKGTRIRGFLDIDEALEAAGA